MKKHLFGFAVFSLIVGTTVFIFSFFKGQPKLSHSKTVVYEVSKQSCWKNVRQNSEVMRDAGYGQASVKIVQAVLNENTRQLNTNFLINRETPSTQNVRVKLTFVNGSFKGKGNWDGVVRTEYVTLSPDFNIDNSGMQSTVSSYQWLDNLKSSENLYVMAGTVYSLRNDLDTVPRKADLENFTPILLMNKK